MKKQIYDYAKLNGRIVEVCGTKAQFAKEMEMSEQSVSKKLLQKVCFKQDEIDNAIIILHLNKEDIPVYFFTYKV